MHETSLIDYALRAVEARAAQLGIEEVAEVGLIVGRAKAVPLLLEKAFQIIRMKHPMCREASLHLEMKNIRMQCLACGSEFDVDDVMGDYRCPSCGSEETRMISGNELTVDYFIPRE